MRKIFSIAALVLAVASVLTLASCKRSEHTESVDTFPDATIYEPIKDAVVITDRTEYVQGLSGNKPVIADEVISYLKSVCSKSEITKVSVKTLYATDAAGKQYQIEAGVLCYEVYDKSSHVSRPFNVEFRVSDKTIYSDFAVDAISDELLGRIENELSIPADLVYREVKIESGNANLTGLPVNVTTLNDLLALNRSDYTLSAKLKYLSSDALFKRASANVFEKVMYTLGLDRLDIDVVSDSGMLNDMSAYVETLSGDMYEETNELVIEYVSFKRAEMNGMTVLYDADSVDLTITPVATASGVPESYFVFDDLQFVTAYRFTAKKAAGTSSESVSEQTREAVVNNAYGGKTRFVYDSYHPIHIFLSAKYNGLTPFDGSTAFRYHSEDNPGKPTVSFYAPDEAIDKGSYNAYLVIFK